MSQAPVNDPGVFMRNILLQGVQSVVKEIADEEIKTAQANIERRVREKVGQIAASAVSELSYERFGHDLRITVRFPPKES